VQVFLAVVLAGLLARLGYQMARSPVLPRFAEELGATPELLGIIIAASTITGIFFKLPSGALSDIIGKKRVMMIGGLFFAFPPFLYPLISDATTLLWLRFLHGFATAIFSPVAAAYVAGLAADKRGARLGWVASANDTGALLGPMIGGFVLFFTASFDATFLFVGVLGVVTLAVIAFLPADQPSAAAADEPAARWTRFWQGLREVCSTPAILVASGAEAAMYLGFGAFLGFLPIYAKDAQLNDGQITVVLGAQLVTALATKPAAGWLSDRVGRKVVIVAGLFAAALSLPLIFRADGFVPLLMFAPLLGVGVGAVTPVTNALVADLARERRLGAAMGVFGTIWDIGESAGPILAGFLIAQFSYGRSFDIIAVAMAAAAIALAFSVKDRSPAAQGR
jgi:MFS family permease